jgi:N-acyl-L-homoserine lactone synthetase
VSTGIPPAGRNRQQDRAEMTTSAAASWIPVTFRLAAVHEAECVQRCRYEVYAEQGFVAPHDHPEGRERDRYDAHAVSAIATAGPLDVVIGTARLILAEDGPLPIEAPPHSIDVITSARVAEISRLCVRPHFRHGRVGMGLFRVLFQVIEERSIDFVYAILDERLLGSLRWIGLPFRRVGPPRSFMGTTIPCVCEVADVVPALRRNTQANLLGVTWLFERPCPERLVL